MAEHLETNETNNETTTVQPEELDALPVDVWECKSDSCNGWMRKNFSFDTSPECPLCESPMKSGTRMIPKLKKEFRSKGINFARRNQH